MNDEARSPKLVQMLGSSAEEVAVRLQLGRGRVSDDGHTDKRKAGIGMTMSGDVLRRGVSTVLAACLAVAVAGLVSGCAVTRGDRPKKPETVITPVFGWKKGDNGWMYPLTPLVGFYRGKRSGMWAFPLLWWQHDKTNERTKFRMLWGGGWRQGGRGASELFPFYHHKKLGELNTRRQGRYGSEFRCMLIAFYKHHHFVGPEAGGGVTRQSVRAFSLWPFVSWSKRYSADTGEVSRRKFSLLWRLIRYDRSPDSRKLDVLFIPIVRE